MRKQAFFHFLQYEKRFSPHTLTAYRSDLEQFWSFLDQEFSLDQPEAVNHHHVRVWVVTLLSNDTAVSSVRRKLSVLKTWFRFLLQQKVIAVNPMQKVMIPKAGKRLPVYVPEKSMHHLLDVLTWPEGFAGTRDRLVIELLYYTGMRRAELLGLRQSDLYLTDLTVRVMGKGQKERLLPLSPRMIPLLEDYTTQRQHLAGAAAHDFFIVTDKGRPAYPKYIYGVVRKYLSLVTTVERKSPHVLRHSFATHLSDRGADLHAIKELLGHANLAATQIYTHNSMEKLRRVYEQAHPRGRSDEASK